MPRQLEGRSAPRVRHDGVAGLDVEEGQVGAADLAVELGPEQDRDLRPVVEPDRPAEERREADARAEAEVLGALEEEHPLLREEHRETGQVDPALVGLGLGEVHVVADDADKVGGEALVEVEAAVELALVVGRHLVDLGRPGQAVGTEGDAQALLDVLDALERGRLVGIAEVAVEGRAREADGLLLAGDRPLDVETPDAQAGLEGDGLERDPDLGRPAVLQAGALGVPDAVPVEARAPGVGQAFAARPLGIDVEDVGVALVLERVEEDADEVVARDRRSVVPVAHVAASAASSAAVVGHGVGRDAVRLAVVAVDADIEAVAVVDDAGLRLLAGGFAGPRLDHAEAVDDRGGLPGGVVQAPVDAGPLIDPDGLQFLGAQGGWGDGRGDDDEERGEQTGARAGRDIHVSTFELSFEILRSSILSLSTGRHRHFRRVRMAPSFPRGAIRRGRPGPRGSAVRPGAGARTPGRADLTGAASRRCAAPSGRPSAGRSSSGR